MTNRVMNHCTIFAMAQSHRDGGWIAWAIDHRIHPRLGDGGDCSREAALGREIPGYRRAVCDSLSAASVQAEKIARELIGAERIAARRVTTDNRENWTVEFDVATDAGLRGAA